MDEIKEKDRILFDQTKKESFNKPFLLFLCILFIFIVGFYFISDKYIGNENIFDQKIRKIESTVNSINNTINNNQLTLVKMQKKLERYQDEKDVLTDLVSQPVKQQFNINQDYALSEVEHLLTIANHNLLLGYDHDTTLSALDAASIRLAGMNIEEATAIQQKINKDIDILRSSNQNDLDEFVLFLSNLSVRIDNFTFNKIFMQSSLQNNLNNKKTKNFIRLVFEELKSLVVITRNEKNSNNFFLPDEINLLKLTIKYELASAKLALLNRDKEILNTTIFKIRNYLANYYDLTNMEIHNAYQNLAKIMNLKITNPNVDITSSLESIRALIRIKNDDGSKIMGDAAY